MLTYNSQFIEPWSRQTAENVLKFCDFWVLKLFVIFSSYFRSINEFHQGPYRYITTIFYHKDSNRQMLWSRNLLMPYLLARFNWHQDPQQDYGSGGNKNILDFFETDTQANILKALSGKIIISNKWRCPLLVPFLRRGSWKCWIKCIILQIFLSELSQTSKMEFFYLKWNFLWKTIFAKRTSL